MKTLADECSQYLDAGLVERSADKINEIYTKAAKDTLEKKKTRKKTVFSHPFKHKMKRKKWYDSECKNQRDIT